MNLEELQEKVGARMRKARQKKGISQKQLSVDHGMSEGYISNLENGKINATLDTLRKYGEWTDSKIGSFFDWE